jgi:hypothetical protein
MSTTTKIIQTGTPTTRKGMPKRKDVRKFSRKWEGKKSGFNLQREQKIRQLRDTKQSRVFPNKLWKTFEETCSRANHCECLEMRKDSWWDGGVNLGTCQEKFHAHVWTYSEYEERCQHIVPYVWQDKPERPVHPARVIGRYWPQVTNSYSYAQVVSLV